MKIQYDKEANALYIYLKKGKNFKTIKFNDRLLADTDKAGNILGIELLDVSSQMSEKQIKSSIKTGIPVFA